MNVQIGTEAAQFPEKEYRNGIFLAVWQMYFLLKMLGEVGVGCGWIVGLCEAPPPVPPG
jgi:hypothetical protein